MRTVSIASAVGLLAATAACAPERTVKPIFKSYPEYSRLSRDALKSAADIQATPKNSEQRQTECAILRAILDVYEQDYQPHASPQERSEMDRAGMVWRAECRSSRM